MTIVKYIMMALSGIATVLCITSGLLDAGTPGIITLVACALPLGLGGMSLVQKTAMPKWAAGTSLAAFLLAAAKTREGDEVQNIMMAAFVGAILAIALLVKPEDAPAAEAEAAPEPAAKPEAAPPAAPPATPAPAPAAAPAAEPGAPSEDSE